MRMRMDAEADVDGDASMARTERAMSCLIIGLRLGMKTDSEDDDEMATVTGPDILDKEVPMKPVRSRHPSTSDRLACPTGRTFFGRVPLLA